MIMTNDASIATTEVLVSPKGEMIAVAPLTNEIGSLLSACATPCSNSPSLPSHSAPPFSYSATERQSWRYPPPPGM